MNAAIWAHLFPPFDAWWPNIIASVIWTVPAFIGQHVAMRRHHRRVLAEHVDAMRRAQAAAAAAQAEKVSEVVGEAIDAAHERLAGVVADALTPRRRRIRE